MMRHALGRVRTLGRLQRQLALDDDARHATQATAGVRRLWHGMSVGDILGALGGLNTAYPLLEAPKTAWRSMGTLDSCHNRATDDEPGL